MNEAARTKTAAPVAELPDEDIVARVVAGDRASFEVLMRRHNRRVYRAARSILRSEADAEDAMQEANVTAYQHLRELDGRSKIGAWLVRIAVNVALQRLRRTRIAAGVEDADLEEATMANGRLRSPEESASDVEVRAVLEETIDALPPAFRAVFVLRAVEEMTGPETAEALGIPEDTVRTRLHRARALLRDEVARRLDRVAPEAFDFHLSRCDRVVAGVMARVVADERGGLA